MLVRKLKHTIYSLIKISQIFFHFPTIPVCSCMKGIFQPFIGDHSLLGVAAFLFHLPCCDNLRRNVYREEEQWLCHWLPWGQPHWSIWPNCAENLCVGRMEPLTDIGWPAGSMTLQRCLFKHAPLRGHCANSINYHYEPVLIQWQAICLSISNCMC